MVARVQLHLATKLLRRYGPYEGQNSRRIDAYNNSEAFVAIKYDGQQVIG